jgi:uncharacterized membrane protein (DUF2068 family)
MYRPPGTHPPPRPRRKVDWELISCGLSGHHIVGTDARTVRERDSAIVRETATHRWHRCLRCDSWLALPPPQEPAREFPPERDEIEIPLRGRALRARFVLRLIAVDRILHFFVLGLLGLALLLFASHETSLRGTFYRVLTDLQRGVGGGPVQSTGHVGILGELNKLFSLQSGKVRVVGLVLLGYALLEGVEAVGLWMTKRWAEYLTFIATTILLPLEVYEIIHKQSVLKIIGFIINLAVVIYLLFDKRLFGLRGGGRADERERRSDMTWEALEHATPPIASPDAA